MGFFKKLGNAFSSSSSKADRALYLYVKCDKCGEIIKVRVDLWNELSPEYDGNKDDASAYQCRKVVVGEKRCYNPIELRLKFDKNHKLVDQKVSGGKFTDESEYQL